MQMFEAEILPLRDLDLGDGEVFRLSRFEFAKEIAESMDDFVRSFNQPIQVAHEDDGNFYGELHSVYLDAEAERIKVRFKTDQQEVIDNIDAEKTKYVSAGFAAPYTTLDGQTFSAALLEVSLTSTPKFLAGDNGQAPIRRIEQEGTILSLKRRTNSSERFHFLSESKLKNYEVNTMSLEELAARLTALEEKVEANKPSDDQEAPEETPKDEPKEEDKEATEAMSGAQEEYKDEPKEDLRARVEELEAKLKAKEDEEKMTAMLSEALEGKEAPTEAKLSVLKKLALSDEASFKVLANELPELAHAGLPVKSKDKKNLSHKSVPKQPNRVSGDRMARVRDYQNEHNCTFADAYKAVGQ